jgi:hypothetical protein
MQAPAAPRGFGLHPTPRRLTDDTNRPDAAPTAPLALQAVATTGQPLERGTIHMDDKKGRAGGKSDRIPEPYMQ